MGKSRSSLGACGAGSSILGVNVNMNTGGGNKKCGLVSLTNLPASYVTRAILMRAYVAPRQRKMIYPGNQLGGVGRGRSMFNVVGFSSADGSAKFPPYEFKLYGQ